MRLNEMGSFSSFLKFAHLHWIRILQLLNHWVPSYHIWIAILNLICAAQQLYLSTYCVITVSWTKHDCAMWFILIYLYGCAVQIYLCDLSLTATSVTYMYLIYLIFHGRARMKWGGVAFCVSLVLASAPKTSFEERVRAKTGFRCVVIDV